MYYGDDPVKQQRSLLNTHLSTFFIYVHQRGALGFVRTPPYVITGMNEARTNIQRIIQNLGSGITYTEEHVARLRQAYDEIERRWYTEGEQARVAVGDDQLPTQRIYDKTTQELLDFEDLFEKWGTPEFDLLKLYEETN